jgi:hypothetical protein
MKNLQLSLSFKLLGFVLLFAMYACKKDIQEPPVNDDAFIAELLKSPESLVVAGNSLILSTYLWRDFMPVTHPDSTSLHGTSKLTDSDSLPIAMDIQMQKQYTLNGSQIWEADYHHYDWPSAFELNASVRNGPKWDPGTEVDVICEFSYQGIIYRLLKRSQIIHATY